ncbi:MAG: glycosyltransferase [Patescibacteria group bacterium]
MKKLFIFGIGPLPFEPSEYNHSGGIRTWYIVQQLLKQFQPEEIDLYLLHAGLNEETNKQTAVEKRSHNGLEYTVIPESQAHQEYLSGIFAQQTYDALITVTTYPSYFVSKAANRTAPWWVDLHGDLLMEAQSKAYTANDNMYVQSFVDMQKQILLKADYISTCSDRQTYATIGELGILGRLTKENEGIPMVHTIPIVFVETDLKRRPVEDGLFRVLSIGGYNTWVDVETMFFGMEEAMRKNDAIRFISTGGGIPGHNMQTYEELLQRISHSPFKDRFDMRGYVSGEEVDELLQTCDLGINADRYNYEGVIGGRNRIHTYISYQLPVLTTTVAETPAQLAQQDVLFTYHAEDHMAFADQVLTAARLKQTDQQQLKDRAAEALRLAKSYYSSSEGIQALIRWSQNPTKTFKEESAQGSEFVARPSRADKAFLLDVVHFGYGNAIRRLFGGRVR